MPCTALQRDSIPRMELCPNLAYNIMPIGAHKKYKEGGQAQTRQN